MAYSTLGWQNGQEPAINAENLNHMDQGIADADAAATAAATIAGQASAALEGKLSKQTGTSRVYTNNPDGTPASLPYSAGVTPNSIPYRTAAGNIYTANPTSGGHAANKQYVDDNFFQKAVVTPSLSTYQDINGYTWQGLYTAMQNAGASPIYLNNANRWLHFGSNQADTICNQVVTFAIDEILGNKFFFVLKYVKEQAGTQTIQEIQCLITSTGVISAA